MQTVPFEGAFESWDAEGGAATASQSWDLRRCLTALRRRVWLVIGIPMLALLIAIAYLSVATPLYEARAKLLIESQTQNVVNFKEVIEQNTAKLDYYETQLGILRSRTLARKTLDGLALWNLPEFSAQKPTTPRRLAEKARSFASSIIHDTSRPAAVRNETAVQSRVIDEFLKRLTISYRADNRLVDVGFRSTDPRLAADAANMIARTYITQSLELKLQASKEASDWLNARLAEQRTHVQASENALQQYREQNADVSLSAQQNIIVQKMAELSTAVTRAKTDRIDTESLYEQLRKMQDAPAAFDELPVNLTNPLIQQLKTELAGLRREQDRLSETFGNRHPDLLKVQSAIPRVEGQLRAEIAKLSESVRNQIVAMREKERSLAGAFEEQERLALALDRRGIQYGTLEREIASNRQIFEALLQRAKQTEISSELRIANTQIVDPAEVPQVPASPQTRMVLIFALFLGLPLGVGVALCLEYLDDRIQSPDEIKTNLGVKFLGFSPAVGRKVSRANLMIVRPEVPVQFAEALRVVRANVSMSAPAQGTQTILVTSAGPREGKTVVAANLAISLAQTGRRVLLVDADLRQYRIHELFEAPLQPGLSSVLERVTPVTEALWESGIPGLSILTAGVPKTNPGDLLETPLFAEVISSLQHRFDWIVIDSPPVLVASDTTALAQVSTAVIFVVGSHMTSRGNAMAALEQLQRGSSRIIGAVLSRGAADPYASYGATQLPDRTRKPGGRPPARRRYYRLDGVAR